jgi:hypothetical protein
MDFPYRQPVLRASQSLATSPRDAVILILYLRAALSQLADPDHGIPTHESRGATVHAGVDRYAQRRSLATPEPVDELCRW